MYSFTAASKAVSKPRKPVLAAKTYSRTAVADQGSHIGLRGSHPIGGGTNFIWEVEQDTPVGKSGSIRQDWRERRENFGR